MRLPLPFRQHTSPLISICPDIPVDVVEVEIEVEQLAPPPPLPKCRPRARTFEYIEACFAPRDPLLDLKMAPAVRQRRERLTRYVKAGMAGALGICVMALICSVVRTAGAASEPVAIAKTVPSLEMPVKEHRSSTSLSRAAKPHARRGSSR